MRGLAIVAFVLSLGTSALAERYFTPVYITKTSAACRQLSSLQYRDSLISQQRSERLSETNTMSAFSGDCTNAIQGQWMFFDGINGKYVCLRPRPGADCYWLRREAVGEIVEIAPAQQAAKGNRPPDCASWSPIVQKSLATEKDIMAKWRASRGNSNLGTDLVRGILTGALGVVTGGPDSRQVDAANACVMEFAKTQEIGRRLYAYSFCPALVGPEQQQRDNAEYRAVMQSIRETCLRNSAD